MHVIWGWWGQGLPLGIEFPEHVHAMATMCFRGTPPRACTMRVASQCTKLAIHGCYKSVYQKPVVDDRKLGVISYFRRGSCLSLSGSERASSHDVTTSNHFLMSQIRAIAWVQFARTGTVQLVFTFQRIVIHVWRLSKGQSKSKKISGRWAKV